MNSSSLYDSTFTGLLDKHCPLVTVRHKVQPMTPWFDAECRATRRRVRAAERRYGLISSQQHGFLRKKSTSTNLLETWNDFTLTLNNKNGITAAYIDYAKAFDSVSHPKLIHKLKAYGIDGNLLSWISDFLRMRTQCVRVGNSLSNTEKIVSGVIQEAASGRCCSWFT